MAGRNRSSEHGRIHEINNHTTIGCFSQAMPRILSPQAVQLTAGPNRLSPSQLCDICNYGPLYLEKKGEYIQ